MKKLYSLLLTALFALPAAHVHATDYTQGLSIWFDTPNTLQGRAIWYGSRPDLWKGESKPEKVLLSLGNYSDEVKTVKLNIDWKQIGLNPQKAKLTAPEIPDMQQAHEWNVDTPIVTAPRKGWIIYLTSE